MSQLFTPLQLRDVTVRNRTVVAPMWQYRGQQGMPTDWHLMHLSRFADGGAGIVFQEATAVERRGCGTTGDIGIWDDSFIPAMTRLATAIKQCGSVPAIQLGHAGRKARTKLPMEGRGQLERTPDIPDWDAWEPIAPSPVALKKGLEPPREMTQRDIADVVASFAAAARRSREAGYEILEVHAAHGYLLHQFLSPMTNRRTDSYGGDCTNRARLLYEVVEAVRAEWPPHLPLFVRMSCVDGAGWEVDDTVAVSRELKRLGVDGIDCSSGGLVGSPLSAGKAPTYGYQVPYSAQVRAEADITTMAVGLIVHAEQAEQIITDGHADLVALGREALHNPNWPFDAALKLGIEDPYQFLADTTGFWLRKRAQAVPELEPSTFTI